MMTAHTGLPHGLVSRLESFAGDHDFADLYRRYNWRRDNWVDGFPDILELEMQLTASARSSLVTRRDVIDVAEWAKHRNPASIECPDTLGLPLHRTAAGGPWTIATDPARLATQLRQATKGLGPTTLSKVLRFAVPRELGAIDSRIVRVVGRGDEEAKRQDWLSLRASNYGSGWSISASQSAWPGDYSEWIGILRFFADSLSDSGIACPHPDGLVTSGLRTRGVWACADVEMALFGWASKVVSRARAHQRCRQQG